MIATDAQTRTYTTFDSPIGKLLALGDGEAVTGLYMQNGRRPATVGASWERDEEPFGELREQLGEYFAGALREFDLAAGARRAPRFSSGSGRRCARSPTARPSATASSPSGSGTRAAPARSAPPTARTRSRSWFPATG